MPNYKFCHTPFVLPPKTVVAPDGGGDGGGVDDDDEDSGSENNKGGDDNSAIGPAGGEAGTSTAASTSIGDSSAGDALGQTCFRNALNDCGKKAKMCKFVHRKVQKDEQASFVRFKALLKTREDKRILAKERDDAMC